jgi:biotin-dependent carboxylase-like uncharacterized protein
VIEVLASGPLATVQDRGRPGWAAIGVSRSGAADRGAAALANRLVGNTPDAAVIEATLGGLALRFDRAAYLVLTGAPCTATLDGHALAIDAPFHASANGVLRLGTPAADLRTYLAVRGGIGVTPVLGSRATDLLTGVGPPPLVAGVVMPIGDDVAGDPPGVDHATMRRRDDELVHLLPGPRVDWFAGDALVALTRNPYVVTAASNRTALRLDGPVLTRSIARELPSEGLVPGAVQVPPDGKPLVFLVDHPVTGGYPVVAVVRDADLDVLAQRRPGDTVRFASAG